MVELLAVEPVLLILVGILTLLADRPAVAAIVGLGPPAVQDTQVGRAVEAGLLATGAASLMRPARCVQPDIHALYQLSRDMHIVFFQKENPPRQARLLRHLIDLLDE